jgi:hypothetical protein
MRGASGSASNTCGSKIELQGTNSSPVIFKKKKRYFRKIRNGLQIPLKNSLKSSPVGLGLAVPSVLKPPTRIFSEINSSLPLTRSSEYIVRAPTSEVMQGAADGKNEKEETVRQFSNMEALETKQ